MRNDADVDRTELARLMAVQRQALQYFLDNQTPDGLVLDRQANFGPGRPLSDGWRSTAATGMGLIAVSLASAEPYRLLTPGEAKARAHAAVTTALDALPEDHGVLPHFVGADTKTPHGRDALSTVDTGWLIGGALWAAAFLGDADLTARAEALYARVDWRHWSAGSTPGLLNHGKDRRGMFLPTSWDRLNGETVLMYVLATGAGEEVALPSSSWSALRPFPGEAAGLRFNNADLGLFAFEYGLDLVDFARWLPPHGPDLGAEARTAARANCLFCRERVSTFATYRHFWGLSDGDGPGDRTGRRPYRAYGPGLPVDGTAHLGATVAAVGLCPREVLANLAAADAFPALDLRGRYGYANVNLDRNWVGQDMVGIDAGAVALALDNFLVEGRVRRTFHALPAVVRAIRSAGFTLR